MKREKNGVAYYPDTMLIKFTKAVLSNKAYNERWREKNI